MVLMITLYTVFAFLVSIICLAIVVHDGGGLLLAKRTWAIAYVYGKHTGLIDTDNTFTYTEIV
jgi:hypothetical protein